MARNLLVLALSVALVAASVQANIAPTDPNLKYNSRWASETGPSGEPQAVCDWSGCSVSVLVTGTRSIALQLQEQGDNYYQFTVNGSKPTVIAGNKSVTVYPLAENLQPSQSYLVFVGRRTEGNQGPSRFLGFAADPTAKTLPIPADSPARRLEFIGDSITCGYGNEGKDGCHFSPDTENHFLAWGPVLAGQLNAEFTTVAWSGKGLVRNYGDKNRTSPDPMPMYYNRTLAETALPLWDFKTLVPNAVLVNLGTNDFSTQPTPDPAVFHSAYLELSRRVASHYPQAKQFFVCGPMIGNPCCGYVQQAAAAAGATYIDLMGILTPPADIGCDGHPSVQGHAKMVQHAEPVVRKVMGW